MDQRTQTPTSLASATIRGTAAMMDIQIGMARQLMSLHARGAAAFGVPDYTEAMNASIDCTRLLLNSTTEQMLNTSRRLTETMTDVQQQLAHVFEQQARTLTDELCRGFARASEGAEDMVRSAGDQVSSGLREIGRASEPFKGADPGARPTESPVTEAFSQVRKEKDTTNGKR
jgi:hypothetical protein